MLTLSVTNVGPFGLSTVDILGWLILCRGLSCALQQQHPITHLSHPWAPMWQPKVSPDTAMCPLGGGGDKIAQVENHCSSLIVKEESFFLHFIQSSGNRFQEKDVPHFSLVHCWGLWQWQLYVFEMIGSQILIILGQFSPWNNIFGDANSQTLSIFFIFIVIVYTDSALNCIIRHFYLIISLKKFFNL